ncbi:hypothetical protein CCP3SC15_1390006 [Gammaproteobacteria bacterium]
MGGGDGEVVGADDGAVVGVGLVDEVGNGLPVGCGSGELEDLLGIGGELAEVFTAATATSDAEAGVGGGVEGEGAVVFADVGGVAAPVDDGELAGNGVSWARAPVAHAATPLGGAEDDHNECPLNTRKDAKKADGFMSTGEAGECGSRGKSWLARR